MVIVEKESIEVRNANIVKLREFHQATLDELGVSTEQLIPKCAYPPPEKEFNGLLHIQFFPTEVEKQRDYYIEFCNVNNLPEEVKNKDGVIINPNRQLYKWVYNSSYEKRQRKSKQGGTLYMVPVSELILINKSTKTAVQQKLQFTAGEEDILLAEATTSELFLELSKRFKGK